MATKTLILLRLVFWFRAGPEDGVLFGTGKVEVGIALAAVGEHAAGRVEDLKSRGYGNAGLYDPQGVGGTHVMYVLQHVDKPELYADLPKDPRISPMVEVWKGVAKPLGVLAIAATAFAGFLHYIGIGRNTVNDEEEEEAEHEAKKIEEEQRP